MPRMSARATAVFLAGILLLWFALPRLRPATDERVAVRETEYRLARASADGNTRALHGIVAHDFYAVNAAGDRETRQTLFNRYRASHWQVESFQEEELKIRLYGKTAVVTGVDHVKARDARGAAHDNAFRFLHVFRKRQGRWWLVAAQLAPVPTS